MNVHEDIKLGLATRDQYIENSETARIAILAGAEFIVGPSFDLETAKLCNRYQVPYMPGCMTIADMVRALEAGCDIIKLFPGSAFKPSFVKDVKGPLPHVNLMPTGGISLDNVKDWIKNGVIAVGVGGQLTKGTPEQITQTAKEFVAKIREARAELQKSGFYEAMKKQLPTGVNIVLPN